MKLKNPILPGFYPDPSICRKGEDYYLVTSTFEYYPGIPVFHSRDLVHWEQIGHVLDRPEQLALDGLNPSRGIYASSIFYHEGRFYVITTLVGNAPYWDNVNFYVWADDPAGPWSDPIIVQGAEGIDPSLVFDEGKVYYLGNCRPYPDTDSTARHIWLQELELSTGRLIGERHTLLDRRRDDECVCAGRTAHLSYRGLLLSFDRGGRDVSLSFQHDFQKPVSYGPL